jgi:hypothetical protein
MAEKLSVCVDCIGQKNADPQNVKIYFCVIQEVRKNAQVQSTKMYAIKYVMDKLPLGCYIQSYLM